MELIDKKRYEIIYGVIKNFKDVPFTILELYAICESVSREFAISIGIYDLVVVVMDLYDNFELDRVIGEDDKIRYTNANREKDSNRGR